MSGLGFTVAIVLALSAVALGQFPDRCHTTILTPHHFLDIDKFMGKWFPLKVAPSKAYQVRELPYTCLDIEFKKSAQDNILTIQETYWNKEHQREEAANSIAIIGELNPEMPIPALQDVYFFGINGTEHSHAVILASDEESWAITYNCRVWNATTAEESISIWSREKTLDPTVEKVLDIIAWGIGFPFEFFTDIPQFNCSSSA